MSKSHPDLEESVAHRPRGGPFWLFAAAAVTVLLWQVPGGNYVLYPFTILATWFHEMAHGLAALMLGGRFNQLLVFSDGSGVAQFSGPLMLGALGRAIVAAAGPLGPPIAGGILILISRSPRTASLGLKVLGTILILSTVLWVRSLFGIIMIPLLGTVILIVADRGSPRVQGFAVQFLGVQACVSTYRQLGYLFSYSAGPLGISDTAQMQQALLLPYWLWGAILAASSLLILVVSLRIAYRPRPGAVSL